MREELTKEQFYSIYKPFTKLNLNDQSFTKFYISKNQKDTFWIKKRRIQGQYQDYFIEEIRKEIQTQIKISLNHPNYVLTIKHFTLFKSKNINIAMIAYLNDEKCVPILKYIKSGQNDVERKIKASKKLLKVYKVLRTSNIWHQNIKPNNVFYLDGEVLISDFGSNRTFHQNYIQQFDQKKEQNWQKDYYFYNPKIILDIIQNQPDYDMRNIEFDQVREQMKRFENVLNVPQNSFNLDAWAVGVIIIQIFYPKDFISQNIDNTFYALNPAELEKKINGITQIDSQLGEGLQVLFYPERQNQQQQQGTIQLYATLRLSKEFQNNPIVPNNPIVSDNQIRIDSVDVQRTMTSQVKATIYLTCQAMDKFLQLVQNQIHPKLQTFKTEQGMQEKLKYILDFHILLQLDLQEVSSYLDDLRELLRKFTQIEPDKNEAIQKSNTNNINKLKENIFLVENRKLALQYFYNNVNYENETPPEEDIIYYYNLKEATMIQWKKQFQIPYEQTNEPTNIQVKPYFSPKKIAGLIKLRKKEIKIEANVLVMLKKEELEIISIYYLKSLPDYKDLLKKKKQVKQKYGAEQFPFNLSLRTRSKAEKFINQGQLEYLLFFEEYNSISAKLKKDYLYSLFKCLDDRIKNRQDIRQLMKGVNQIYPELKFKFKDKYAIAKLKYGMLPSELCKEIQIFFQQKYSVSMKVEYQYLDYLKQFDSIQNQKNYVGYLVNGKPHGQGFRRINKETLQFGIFRYGQLIWGWEIVKDDEKILVYHGEFQNDQKIKQGKNKAFVKEVNAGQSIFRKLK